MATEVDHDPDYDMQVLAQAAEITKSESRVRAAVKAAEEKRDAAAQFVEDHNPPKRGFNNAPKKGAFKFEATSE